jgi:PKD repeat protein
MSGSVNVTINTAPEVYSITGSSNTALCPGEELTIGLSNSQNGVSYQLLKDNSSEGSAVTGDGNTITFGNFSAAGTYTVTATSANGCTSTMTGSVVITVNEVPTADFTVTSTNVGINNEIVFTNTSTGNNTYSWDFGDGASSTEVNPTHTYTTQGTYTVTLTATNDCGTDTKTEPFTVTLSYCEVSVENNLELGIYKVIFGSIDNDSGFDTVDGYNDFTNISTNVVQGTTEDLSVSIDTFGSNTFYTSVWIDWNQDGVYNMNDELYDLGLANNGNGITIAGGAPFQIQVPSNAILGNTRMRIITRFSTWPFNACTNVEYGEIEDYTIIVVEPTNTWIGDDEDVITDTNNWSLGMVPDETQSVVISDNAHLKIVDDRKFMSVTVRTNGALTIDKTGSVTTTNDFTVENGGTVDMLSELANRNNPSGAGQNNGARDQFASLVIGGEASGEINYLRAARLDRHGNGNNILRSYISSPVVNETFDNAFLNNGTAIAMGNTGYIFAQWLAANNSWGVFNHNSNTPHTMVPGKGYLVGMQSTSNDIVPHLKFTGDIQNNDEVSIAVNGTGASSWEVLGNPYAGYLDIEQFIAHNQDAFLGGSNAGIYAWTGTGGNTVAQRYKVWNKSNARLLRPGQGFTTRINGATTVTFKKEWVTTANPAKIDTDFSGRSATPAINDYVVLHLSSPNQFTMATEVYFNPHGTNGLDVGYDTEVYGGQAGNNFGIYTHLVENSNNKDMAIQTLDYNNMSAHVIPLGINLNAGSTGTISLADVLLPENMLVYLEDRVANVWTILNNVDYTFTATANLTDTGRFFIHFEDNSATLSNNEFDLNKLEVRSLAGQKTVVVNGQLDSDSVLELYDMMGRVVLSKSLKSYQTTHNIDASQLPVAAYIVKVSNNTQSISKQILIN